DVECRHLVVFPLYGRDEVVSQTNIECQFLRYLPFVLQVPGIPSARKVRGCVAQKSAQAVRQPQHKAGGSETRLAHETVERGRIAGERGRDAPTIVKIVNAVVHRSDTEGVLPLDRGKIGIPVVTTLGSQRNSELGHVGHILRYAQLVGDGNAVSYR